MSSKLGFVSVAICCCSVTQSYEILRPHGLQHTRLPCPSLSLSLLKLVSIDSVMLSNHLILCSRSLWSLMIRKVVF